ncbi:MAG: ribosome silencing factor [Nitrospirae bacterium]|nr:ribosome silencing factor [Nitrospirota bacterium]
MLSDKKAKDIVILEMKSLTSFADYFVICSGENPVHIKALSEEIEERLSKNKVRPMGVEGLGAARWVLMDYGDIIVHIFDEDTRDFYQLEKLWLDAPKIPIKGYKE